MECYTVITRSTEDLATRSGMSGNITMLSELLDIAQLRNGSLTNTRLMMSEDTEKQCKHFSKFSKLRVIETNESKI